MATTTEIATLLATHHAELQRDLAEHHRKIIAQLEHIAILVQPAPQVRQVFPKMFGTSPVKSRPIVSSQVNISGDAIQVVPLDVGIPLPSWIAVWLVSNPVLRWLFSITWTLVIISVSQRMATSLSVFLVLPAALTFGKLLGLPNEDLQNLSFH
jgi:hypothetical protein